MKPRINKSRKLALPDAPTEVCFDFPVKRFKLKSSYSLEEKDDKFISNTIGHDLGAEALWYSCSIVAYGLIGGAFLIASLLAVNDDLDRPAGVTKGKYALGFVVTLGASGVYALLLSIMQLTCQKVIKEEAFSVVLELQIYTSFFATSVSTIGLFASGVVGLVFVVSSLFSNVISTLSLALTPLVAVAVFHDKMNGVKIIAMLLG
ncbi:probable purine permease 11 isoform X2 [Tanacetum coccineum]